MIYRCGLFVTLVAVVLVGAPCTAHGNPSGSQDNPFLSFDEPQISSDKVVSAEQALILARQAAELSQRAAKMAAAANNKPAAARQAVRQPVRQPALRTANRQPVFRKPQLRQSIVRPQQRPDAQSEALANFIYGNTTRGRVILAADEEMLPTPEEQYADNSQLVQNDHFIPDGETAPLCGDACCPPPPPLFWVSGVEASFLWPTVNSEEGAVFAFEDEETEIESEYSSFTDDVDSMYLTPRIWVGVQGCKWGTNLRYWHLRANEGGFDPQLDNLDYSDDGWDHGDWGWDKEFDTGYFTNNRLDVYTIDLEVNRRFCVHDCAMQASVGVRHGSIEHHESIVGTVLGDDSRFAGYARSDRYTHGTGFVFGLYGRKPLFPCSCVHWFYNARLSTLWGPTMTNAETFAAVMADGSSAGSINNATTCVDDNMFIGEIQLGLEWNYALRCLPANAFCRAAIEYQRWDGGTGFSESLSFAAFEDDNDFESEVTAFASAAEPQLDLFGITIGTGLTW
jgi:hypothetical protein